MQSAKRSNTSSQAGSSSSKSQKAKGKQREVETKRPPSQLKQGWALVPLVLGGNENSDGNKKRSRTPTKRQSMDDTPILKSRKTSKTLAPKRSSAAIEILSSDDDEIQEISVASTSKSCTTMHKTISKKSTTNTLVKKEIVEVEVAAIKKQYTPGVSAPPPEIVETFDLQEDDDNDEDEEIEIIRRKTQPSEFADENEGLEDVDDWGDVERVWQRSREGSREGSMYAEEYAEESGEIFERSGDSDEDILEVSLHPAIHALATIT